MPTLRLHVTDRENRYLQSSDAVYATAVAGASASIAGSSIGRFGQTTGYSCYQAFQFFDLTQLPSSATITNVSYATYSLNNANRGNVTLEIYEHDYGTLDATDWRTPTQIGAKTLLATSASSSYPASGGFVTWTESSTNLTDAVIAAHGERRGIGIVSTTDQFRLSSAPTGGEYVGQSGESYLSITYTVPAGVSSSWIENESIANSFHVRCSDPTYTNAARGTGSLSPSGVGYSDPCGQLHSGSYFVYQHFGEIDLSAIPKGSEILSVDVQYIPSAIFPIDTWYMWMAVSDNDGTIESAAYYPSTTTTRNLETLRDEDAYIGEDYVNGASLDVWQSFSVTTDYAMGLARIQDAVNSADQVLHYVMFSQDQRDEIAPAVSTNATVYFESDPNVRIQVSYIPPSGGAMIGVVF